MCGFAGIVSAAGFGGRRDEQYANAVAMGAQLARRGPDDEQFLVDDHVALVFRRLAVIDCVTGRQPIANEDGSLFLVCNGEIYNHRELRRTLEPRHQFRTRSDSEVILHLYEEFGADCLSQLRGMFACAIWDARRERLFLGRDRLGIKPLYVIRRGMHLLFGSEVKALLAHPDCSREFNWHDWTPAHGRLATFVAGVDAVPAGHFLTWDRSGDVHQQCYWNLDTALATPDEGLTATDYVERFADLLEDSVDAHLISDVPVGAFLSGGLDSAALVAVAAHRGAPLPCFTIVEKSTIASGDAAAAAAITSALAIPFHPVLFDNETLAGELQLDLSSLEYFIWLMEYPLFTVEFLFKHELYRFAKTVVPDIKVMLIGQGIDEFAGGYSHGINTPHATWQQYVDGAVVPLWKTNRRNALGIPHALAPLLADETYGDMLAPFSEEMRCRLHTLQLFNLWHEDRTSSGQGIEARVPYLDHQLVELLASIPARLHEELFWDKEIVRRAARRWLPEDLVRRRKVPFVYTPNRASLADFMHGWLSAIFPAFAEKYLEGPHRLFDRRAMAALLRLGASDLERKERAVRQVTECMALSIFSAMCRKGPGDFSGAWCAPSPLRRWDTVTVSAAGDAPTMIDARV